MNSQIVPPNSFNPAVAGWLRLAVALAFGVLSPSNAPAATIYGDTNDCEVQFTLATPPYAIADLTAGGLISGTAGTVGKERCPVFVFQLPDWGAVPNPFTTATFSCNYSSKLNTPAGNVDVYGLGRRASPTVQTNDYWTGTSAMDATDATFLDDNLIRVNSTDYGLKATSAAGSSNLAAYLNGQYANGAGAGQFVFLRLSTDAAQAGVHRYVITSAEGAMAASDLSLWPQINFTTVPLGDPVDTIRVETRADGSGTVVPAMTIQAGVSVTNYAVARDGGGAFLENIAASWVLTNITGAIASGNLAASADGRSAVFTPGGAGSARILAVGNATNLVPSYVFTVTAATNPFARPFIWVRDSEKAGILAKIAANTWATNVFKSLVSRAASDVASHQANRDSFLRQLPINWTASPPAFKSIPTYSESSVRGPAEAKFNTGLDCAVLYYLTGDAKYARCAADILHNAAQGLRELPPATDTSYGGWIWEDDLLYEARVTGMQLPIMYDFLYQFLAAGNQVYDVETGGLVAFSFTDAQFVFRTMYNRCKATGKGGSNWFSLKATTMVNNLLALDDPTERATALQVYLVAAGQPSNQGSLDDDAQAYVQPGDIWPESLQYSGSVGQNDTHLMVMLERYDSNLALFNAYPNLPLSLSRASYLKYPNSEAILFGDGHRDNGNQPFPEYEMVYRHVRDRGRTNLTALYGALINGGVAAGSYNRSTLPAYESLGRRDELSHLLWSVPTISEPATSLNLPRTDTLPFAGIALQRNLSPNNDPTYGMMGFVGGAAHVHSHACGMNMELYGLDEVLGAKSGRTAYGDTINENYYRVFAANNTIIVNGSSRGEGGWKGLGMNTVQVVAMEPKSFTVAVASNHSFTCSSFVDDKGTKAEGTQQRTLAIIRTSPTNGYYVDIFRSKSTISNVVATTLTGNITNQFHDYIYHNLGETLDLQTNGMALPLVSQPARFQSDIGDAIAQPGWRYFTNTVVSEPHSAAVRAQFKAKPTGGSTLYMDLHIPGAANREYARVTAPALTESPAPYDTKLSSALVMRQIGEAWNSPFAVVYEPHLGTNTSGSVTNVTTLVRSNILVGLKVQSKVGSRALVQYVISNPNSSETYSNAAINLSFTGRFAVVTDNGDTSGSCYLGQGSSLTYKTLKVAGAGGTNTGAYVEFTNGTPTVINANSPVNVTRVGGPTLAALTNRTLLAGQTLVITNVATDPDLPAQTLTFSLLAPPPGAAVNPSNGVFTWRPTIAQSPSIHPISVKVADNGSPSQSATQTFQVTVTRPALPTISNVSVNNDRQFTFQIAGDAGPDYQLQASTNLVNWTTLLTTNPVTMPFQFTDGAATNYSRRFFRVTLGP